MVQISYKPPTQNTSTKRKVILSLGALASMLHLGSKLWVAPPQMPPAPDANEDHTVSTLPTCTSLEDIGTGEWILTENEGYRWSPSQCQIPYLSPWTPASVQACATRLHMQQLVYIPGEPTDYLSTGFANWLHGENVLNSASNEMEYYSFPPLQADHWNEFAYQPLEHSLIVFGIPTAWETLAVPRYMDTMQKMARRWQKYQRQHPTNRVIAKLPSKDSNYRTMAERILRTNHIEIWADNEGLMVNHVPANVDEAMMQVLLGVICHGDSLVQQDPMYQDRRGLRSHSSSSS